MKVIQLLTDSVVPLILLVFIVDKFIQLSIFSLYMVYLLVFAYSVISFEYVYIAVFYITNFLILLVLIIRLFTLGLRILLSAIPLSYNRIQIAFMKSSQSSISRLSFAGIYVSLVLRFW